MRLWFECGWRDEVGGWVGGLAGRRGGDVFTWVTAAISRPNEKAASSPLLLLLLLACMAAQLYVYMVYR